MKILYITILFTLSLFGDEMQRIDSIVQDITKLRKNYATCQESLKNKEPIKVDMLEYQDNDDELRKYKRLLKDEREKNIILNNELDSLSLEYADMKSKQVDKIIEIQENDKNIEKEIEKEVEKEKEIQVVEVVKLVEVCSNTPQIDPNPFPKLMPKEIKVEKTIKETIVKEKKKTSRAKTYRLNKDSAIYDAPNSKEIDSWEKGSSFTSSEQTDNWIKITGYFVDKKFIGAKKSMWVEQTNAILR